MSRGSLYFGCKAVANILHFGLEITIGFESERKTSGPLLHRPLLHSLEEAQIRWTGALMLGRRAAGSASAIHDVQSPDAWYWHSVLRPAGIAGVSARTSPVCLAFWRALEGLAGCSDSWPGGEAAGQPGRAGCPGKRGAQSASEPYYIILCDTMLSCLSSIFVFEIFVLKIPRIQMLTLSSFIRGRRGRRGRQTAGEPAGRPRTGDKIIAEAAPGDCVWGGGLGFATGGEGGGDENSILEFDFVSSDLLFSSGGATRPGWVAA